MSELRSGNGEIPVNAEGIGWFFSQGESFDGPVHRYEEDEVAEFVTVTDLDSGADVEFSIKAVGPHFYLVKPKSWSVGKRYRVTTETPILEIVERSPRQNDSKSVEVAVVEAFEPDVFQITATEPEFVRSSVSADASCSWEIDVVKRMVHGAFPGHALDMSLIHFETRVDERHWRYLEDDCEPIPPGGYPGEFRMFAACDNAARDSFRDQYPQGAFEVTTRAFFPGTNLSWEADPIVVNLECGPDDPGYLRRPKEPSGCSVSKPNKSTLLPVVIVMMLATRRPRRITDGNPKEG